MSEYTQVFEKMKSHKQGSLPWILNAQHKISIAIRFITSASLNSSLYQIPFWSTTNFWGNWHRSFSFLHSYGQGQLDQYQNVQ